MLALILAGGQGTRLGMGEKPLVTLCGVPMIAYVIDAFTCRGHETVVIASASCPYTVNWCRARKIPCFVASGVGYVEDLVEAGGVLEPDGPVFTCVADLPLLTPGIIRKIEELYTAAGTKACSVWIPLSLCKDPDHRKVYAECIGDIDACPAGINILDGGEIASPQEETRLLLDEPRLSHNVNTREDLAMVQRLLCSGRGSFPPRIPHS